MHGINDYLFMFIFCVFHALNCSFHSISRFRMPRHSLYLREKVVKLDHVTNWFISKNMKVLDVPSRSLDLGPIEYLWEELDRRISDIKVNNSKFSNIAGPKLCWIQTCWWLFYSLLILASLSFSFLVVICCSHRSR